MTTAVADELTATFAALADPKQGTPLRLHDPAGAPDPLRGPGRHHHPIDGITVDLRPAGVFETTMVNDADGSSYPTHAVYAH